MIGNRESQPGLGDLGVALVQPGKRVEGAFMHVVAVDPEQRLPVFATHDLVHRP